MAEDAAGWLTAVWTVISIAGFGLAMALAYLMWTRRAKGPVAERRRDEATERVFRQSERDEKDPPSL